MTTYSVTVKLTGRLAIVLVASILVAAAATAVIYPDASQMDMIAGWAAGSLFHLLGFFIFRRAVGKSPAVFMALGMGMIFLRLFVLIILIVIVLVGGFLQLGPFLIGLLAAYFIGSWMEIAWLASTRNSGPSSTI